MTAVGQGLPDRSGAPLPLGRLAGLWPLGGWGVVEAVPAGKNEHLRLVAGDGTFYLRRSFRSKRRTELVAQLGLMRTLDGRGLPVPRAVPSRQGNDHEEVDGRFWVVTEAIDGAPFDDASPAHVAALGRTLARYHQLVSDLPADGGEPELVGGLRRSAGEPGLEPELRGRAERLAGALSAVLPDLPRCVVHGGARRGSLLFDGDEVVGVLDLDSAHPDVRVLDLAVAVHDVGKVYTRAGAADHKVALDLRRVAGLLDAYAGAGALTAAEARALPLLVEAKRLKRALGRIARACRGEPLSVNDHAKIALERRRLRWLDAHGGRLHEICGSAVR